MLPTPYIQCHHYSLSSSSSWSWSPPTVIITTSHNYQCKYSEQFMLKAKALHISRMNEKLLIHQYKMHWRIPMAPLKINRENLGLYSKLKRNKHHSVTGTTKPTWFLCKVQLHLGKRNTEAWIQMTCISVHHCAGHRGQRGHGGQHSQLHWGTTQRGNIFSNTSIFPTTFHSKTKKYVAISFKGL